MLLKYFAFVIFYISRLRCMSFRSDLRDQLNSKYGLDKYYYFILFVKKWSLSLIKLLSFCNRLIQFLFQ